MVGDLPLTRSCRAGSNRRPTPNAITHGTLGQGARPKSLIPATADSGQILNLNYCNYLEM